MGAAPFIIIAAGMVIPIVVLLATVVFDAVMIAWAGYRLVRNRRSPAFAGHVHSH